MGKRLTVKEKNEILAQQDRQLKNYGLILRVYPTEDQATLIHKTVGCARLIFNKYLHARQSYYKEHGKSLSVNVYKKETLVPMKRSDDFRFLKEVDKFALEVACESVEDAYTRFFKHQNRYPRFKSKRKAKKAYTTKMTNNNIQVIGSSYIKLPKLGKVSIAKLKTKRNIDLGLKTFAVTHNGSETEFIERARYIKDSEKKLVKLQGRLSRKQKESQNFIKAKQKVADLQAHIANQRKDFAHKLSSQLANENQVVILETLNIKGMVKNKRVSKAISDAGWYQFITFLKYKLEWQGKHLVQIDPWYASSKSCSGCGEKHIALTLNDREWVCSHCGAGHERDENAAINIRNKSLETLGLLA